MTDGLFTIGFISTTSMVTAHHLMIMISTRNWNIFAILHMIVSYFLYMPLGIIAENIIPENSLYKTAFSDGMH